MSRNLSTPLLLALLSIPRTAVTADETLPLWRALDWFRGAWIGNEEGMIGRRRAPVRR